MKATFLLRWALEATEQGLLAILEGLERSPTTPSTPGGKGGEGNHAIWTLGHLCVIEGNLRQILLDEPNPVEPWRAHFGAGTKPPSEASMSSGDASQYPSFDELLRTFRELRAGTLAMLDRLDDADLDAAPPNVPPGFEEAMQTVGQTYLLTALHAMVHYGQLADVRRVVGLPPLL